MLGFHTRSSPDPAGCTSAGRVAATHTFGRTLPFEWVAQALQQTFGGLDGGQLAHSLEGGQRSVPNFYRVRKEGELEDTRLGVLFLEIGSSDVIRGLSDVPHRSG